MRRRHYMMSAVVAGLLSVALVAFPGGVARAGGAPLSPTARPSAATPTVTGPIAGTPFLYGTNFDLSQVGYEQSEYFLSGTATSYTSSVPLTSDGKWTVTPATTAPYTTRAVVYRPIDPKKFNGTVVVEWLNVSGGVDDGPDWVLSHNELVREGAIWVGVSAQQVGVNAAKAADPARYSSLSHPGDSYSYDIFSQAGQGIRHDSALMLGGLTPRHVIAVGESQSAFRLVTYIDAVQPLVHVFDGFLVHSQFGTGAPLSQAPQVVVTPPTPTFIRSHLGVPVFEFETETDVSNSTLYDRQPDTSSFRLWEVAGSSHFDYYGLIIGPADTGNGAGAILNLAAMQNPPTNPPPGFDCTLPINTGGTHWNLDAALYWLNQWVAKGTPPPRAPRLRTASAPGVSPVVFVRDAYGNVEGGVRSPQVDAPVAALGGVGNTPAPGASALGVSCPLFGTTVPFSPTELASLYHSHAQFVSQWDRAVRQDVERGFLVRADARELKDSAATSLIGR